jgi:hypothetical protein
MTLRLDRRTIVFSEFGCLEPTEPQWLKEKAYWEDFNQRFFRSNGLPYGPADSNVDLWLTALDRAPFAFMVRELLPLLGKQADLANIDFVLLAHWLPDLHLGTSVTNFALHHLGLTRAFGFAISDRGRSAPLFALNCISRYLIGERKRAVLMVMDQKHLLYRSPLVETLDPGNTAALMVLERDGSQGMHYAGYRRYPGLATPEVGKGVARLCEEFGLAAAQTTLIADPEVLSLACHSGPMRAQDPKHLCSAPFAVLSQAADTGGDSLILIYEEQCLSAVCLREETWRGQSCE